MLKLRCACLIPHVIIVANNFYEASFLLKQFCKHCMVIMLNWGSNKHALGGNLLNYFSKKTTCKAFVNYSAFIFSSKP